jgi:ABC-type glycerol-3-phosphate transport system substrate-binding protein
MLTSCGGKKVEENKEKTPKGPVTLNFTTFYEEGSQAEAYKEIIKAFEDSYSNIKVILQASPVNYDEKIKTSLNSSKGPDIIGLQRNKMIEYIKLGNIKDISSLIEDENVKSKYYGVNPGYGKYNGKYYGIGDLPAVTQWYYNVSMFKKAGLSEPRNLDELISACSKLRKYTKTPIMVGFKDSWAANTFFGMITAQTMRTDELSKAFSSADKSAFQSLNGAEEAVDIFNRLLKSEAISKSLADYDYAQSIDAFVKGKAAILPMGSWAIEKIEATMPKGFSYKAFETPVQFTDKTNSLFSATSVQVVTVNEKSKYPKESLEFMKFLLSDEAQKIFAKKNGVSGLKSANAESQNPVQKQLIRQLGMTDENSTMYIDNISDKMAGVTGDRLLQLITGKIKASEVWKLIIEESHV